MSICTSKEERDITFVPVAKRKIRRKILKFILQLILIRRVELQFDALMMTSSMKQTLKVNNKW